MTAWGSLLAELGTWNWQALSATGTFMAVLAALGIALRTEHRERQRKLERARTLRVMLIAKLRPLIANMDAVIANHEEAVRQRMNKPEATIPLQAEVKQSILELEGLMMQVHVLNAHEFNLISTAYARLYRFLSLPVEVDEARAARSAAEEAANWMTAREETSRPLSLWARGILWSTRTRAARWLAQIASRLQHRLETISRKS